jgi:hypothetical protein
MNEQEYHQTLQTLEQAKIAHWNPLMNGGKPLLDRLMRDMLAVPRVLTVRQQVNGLMVLFRLRGWGNQESLITALKIASESNALEVREQAAKLMIGLVRLSQYESHKNEKINAVPLKGHLRSVLLRGVKKRTLSKINMLLRDAPDEPEPASN